MVRIALFSEQPFSGIFRLGQIINAVLPVFAIIGVGWLAGYRRVVDETAAAAMNRFVFFFALPALMFRLLATAPIDEFSWPLLAAYFAGQLVVWLAAFAAMALIWKRSMAERVIGAVSAGLPNHVFLALPIVIWLLGEAGALPVLMIVALDSLVIYSVTLVLMEIATHDGPDRHPFRAVFDAYRRSPQLITILLGLGWALAGFPLPVAVETATTFLGAAAAPTALFVLGSHLSRARISGDRAMLASLIGLKIIVHPILVWLIATGLFGLSGNDLWVAVLVATAPVGATSFVLGQHYGLFRDEASAIVTISTALSFFTMSAVILLM